MRSRLDFGMAPAGPRPPRGLLGEAAAGCPLWGPGLAPAPLSGAGAAAASPHPDPFRAAVGIPPRCWVWVCAQAALSTALGRC